MHGIRTPHLKRIAVFVKIEGKHAGKDPQHAHHNNDDGIDGVHGELDSVWNLVSAEYVMDRSVLNHPHQLNNGQNQGSGQSTEHHVPPQMFMNLRQR